MNISNDYMLVLDEIRASKKITITDLCGNLITERTYYRMLKANQVKTDVFTQLVNRLGVDLSEFIHYAMSVRKSDSRFKFIYRVHTKYYRDINEHYQAMLVYQDPVEELDLLIKVYIKKYEFETLQITLQDYHSYLKTLVSTIQSNTTFNIYLFTIQLIILKEFPGILDITVKDTADQLFKEEFSYSVIMIAICYDELLSMIMASEKDANLVIRLMSKFEIFMSYFPIRFFWMRFNLFKAYLGKIQEDYPTQDTHLYKYFMNALSMVEMEEYEKQKKIIERIFQIDTTRFLHTMTQSLLY